MAEIVEIVPIQYYIIVQNQRQKIKQRIHCKKYFRTCSWDASVAISGQVAVASRLWAIVVDKLGYVLSTKQATRSLICQYDCIRRRICINKQEPSVIPCVWGCEERKPLRLHCQPFIVHYTSISYTISFNFIILLLSWTDSLLPIEWAPEAVCVSRTLLPELLEADQKTGQLEKSAPGEPRCLETISI